MGFYSVEYARRKGEHPTQENFNPNFFLKIGSNIVVFEIKYPYLYHYETKKRKENSGGAGGVFRVRGE